VWKQYLLVAAMVLVALVLVTVVAYNALAVELATPPATLIGGRVVLATSEVPSVGAGPKRFGPPQGPSDGAFYLIQPERGAIVAIKETWRPEGAAFVCLVGPEDPIISAIDRGTFTWIGCGSGSLGFGLRPSSWDAHGDPILGTDQPLDRYLVSVEGARVVVNTSRVISGVRKVPAPSDPTFR
jgi:hypothetical protein